MLASEFGRDAITEGKVGKEVRDQSNTPDVMRLPMHYGMHRHFTAAGSVVLFGGGVKRGYVYGKTADERPCTTIENPVPVEDLHATLYHALGIAPTTNFVVEKRPVYVTKDGKGKVNSHRLKAVARVTGCKPSFRPKAGRMGPAPSGLQEVDGLNHLLGNLHPDRYFDQLYTSQSPRPSHCPNCSRSSRAPTSAAPKTAS